MATDDEPTRPVIETNDENTGGPPRIRKNTMERFNEELAVLDRPLEDEVEYYDEEPTKKFPRPLAVGVALAALAAGGLMLLPRLRGDAGAATELAVAPVAAATVAIAAPPAPAPAVEPAPLPPPAETAPVADSEPAPPEAPAPAAAPSAWSKLGKVSHSAGPTKHARAPGHKARPRAHGRHK